MIINNLIKQHNLHRNTISMSISRKKYKDCVYININIVILLEAYYWDHSRATHAEDATIALNSNTSF